MIERTGDSTDLECCELLHMMVRLFKPWIIIEAGTHTGHSAIAMADACMMNGHGRVHTADPTDYGVESNEWLKYHQDTFEGMVERLAPLNPTFAFIDASGENHDNRMRLRHFKLAVDIGCDVVIVHDTNTGAWAGPHTDWEDVLTPLMKLCDYNIPIGKGLSVWVR